MIFSWNSTDFEGYSMISQKPLSMRSRFQLHRKQISGFIIRSEELRNDLLETQAERSHSDR